MIRHLGVFHFTNLKGNIKRSGYIYEGRVISGDYSPEFPGCLGKWFSVNNPPYNTSSFTRRVIKTFDSENVSFPAVCTFLDNSYLDNFHLFLLHPFLGTRFLLKNVFKR